MRVRFSWKWAMLALAALSPALWLVQPSAQDAASSPARKAQSSLDLGPAYDYAAQLAFERSLSESDAQRLIRLRSRFALAETSCPLPQGASTPFYITFKQDLSRELANRLRAAGVRFMGYIWQRTHIVRVDDAQALLALRPLFRAEPQVLGTLLARREDKLSRGAFDRASQGGEFQVLFWRDSEIAQAAALLDSAGAEILEATRGQDNAIDLNTPIVKVRVSAAGFETLAQSNLVEFIEPAPWRVTDNQVSAGISNATSAIIGVAPYNLDGTGQIAAVWDNGHARDTHEQFQGAPSPSLISNGTKRVLRVETSGTADHGCHVTGTIIGDGTNNAGAKGFAPKAYVLAHLWDNVDQERRNAKHNWNHVADNHSYSSVNGTADDWGQYTADCQVNDWTNRDYLVPMVQSAGNYATSSPGGAYPKPFADGSCSVTSFNAHRNGLIMAASTDANAITSFSSRGPCMDGRLVPQFCANGEGLTSAIRTADNAYASYSGTSMSSPSMTGSLTLLSQLWRNLHSNRILEPDTVRSVLALTCQDQGNAGPDYQFGFGIVDVKAAADLMLADTASGGKRIVRGYVHQGEVIEFTVTVPAATPVLAVSCSWLDVYCNANASVAVVNDLDLELVEPNGTTIRYPYAGLTAAAANSQNHVFTTTGPNRRDNIELCRVATPAAGTWKVRVRGFSIPANPQTEVPNDVTGFVLASSLNLNTQTLLFEDSLNTGAAVSIPDNNATGVVRNFVVNDPRVITQVRVYTRIVHNRRGDVQIILESPLGTMVNLKTVNSGDMNTYTDVIGVFPDTRQYDDDMTALVHQHITGTWKVHVRDRVATNTGTLSYLALEFNLRTNAAPSADAGTAFSLREVAPGQLNATASSDPEGNPITYQWAQIAGAVTVTLAGANTATPSFTAPSVSQNEVVTFEVTVRDASLDADTATVQVTILNNAAPVAFAGNDDTVRENDPVQLSAVGSSNAESDPMTYAWTQLSGTTATLTGANTQTPTFTAPWVSADDNLVFQVTVTDDRGDFTTDTVTITVLNNAAPQANAGSDFAALEGTAALALDASASSDAESDPLTYAWTQTAGTAVTLNNATTAVADFDAPLVSADEVLEFEVTVTDDRGDFTTDRVQVTVEQNLPPVANAGPDQGAQFMSLVQLNGSGSTDPNTGDTLTYAWTQISGTTVTLTGANTAFPSFVSGSKDANLTFELTVTDSFGLVSTDQVRVVVNKSGVIGSGGGGGKKDTGGCSTDEAVGVLWLAGLMLALLLRRSRRDTAKAR
ncbi:Minor extracellular protease Epr [Planctomycetaceae bacterium]|nr:Minor extracellular protease Epr [Planctomycetaceae bacterium]